MTKRKLLAIFFALAIGVSLTACGNKSQSAEKSETVTQSNSDVKLETEVQDESNVSNKYSGLVLISHTTIGGSLSQYQFYDPDTMVMYSYFNLDNRTWNGSMIQMVNADGTPKLYSPDSKTE